MMIKPQITKFLPSRPPLLLSSVFMIVLSITLSNHALADNTQQQIDTLNQKIEHLEHQKDNLDKQTELLNKELERIEADLQNSFTAKSLEIDKQNLEVEKHFKTSWAVIIFSMIGGAVGLFGIFISLKSYIENKAKKLAEEKIKEEVSEQIKVNKNQLEQLIDAHNLEKTLRQKKHILAIVEKAEDKEDLEAFFKNVGIDKVSYRINEPYSSPESHIDLVLFRDTREKGNDQELHDFFKLYIENSTPSDQLVFFYYGNNRFEYSKEDVNFSNSKFTFYNQLINSLRHQHLVLSQGYQ